MEEFFKIFHNGNAFWRMMAFMGAVMFFVFIMWAR